VTKTPAEIAQMFSRISGRYDLANRVLSFARDGGWRRQVVNWANPQPNERILDLCTGTADLIVEFNRREESAMLWGLDLSGEMLAVGQRKLRIQRCDSSALLIEGNALQLPFASGAFDIVTIAFGLRNLPDIPSALAEMVRVLRPGGRLLILEFALPVNALWRSLYLSYLKHVVPKLGALITGSRSAYEYLYRSVLAFPGPQELLPQLERAGLARPECFSLAGGIAMIYRAIRLCRNP